MGLAVLFITVLVLLISYRFYATRRANQTVEPSWSRSTPARRKMDGVNFMPSPPAVNAGFQFKSISLDVIIGPVIAIQFGWLPAILWLLFGAVFFGWILDYFSTIMSIRSGGSPIGDLIGEFFNPKSRKVILVFIYIYLLSIIGQFGLLLSTLLGRENVAPGVLILVFAGFFAGLMIYRWRMNLVIASFLSVLIAFLGIWSTTTSSAQDIMNAINKNLDEIGSLDFPAFLNSPGITMSSLFWLLILFVICYLIAVMTIWRIAVPLNYISSWLVILTLGLAVVGLIIGTISGSINATFEIPPLITRAHPNLGTIWPILFVTLSSGAVSGWHSLVSSFSTARQVEKEPIVMPITTGGMFGETVMVVIVIIFAATYGVSAGIFNPAQSYSLKAGPASILAVGLAKSWNEVGLPETFGGSLSALFLTMMGITILHLVLRYSGMVSTDLFDKRFRALGNPKISNIFVILLSMIIIVFGFWQPLWVLFAGANQLLAAIVLLLASSWLVKLGKSYWWTLIPSLTLFVTAMAALFYSAIYQALYQQILLSQSENPVSFIGNLVTISIGLLFMILGAYLFFAGWQQMNRSHSNQG